ncbi:hypothetical protein PHYSODRAFT_383693, partial [Phytophthora sojae]
KEGPVCYYCKKPGHLKRDCNKLKKDQGNETPRQLMRDLAFTRKRGYLKHAANLLLDCGATTIYVSRGFGWKNNLRTHVYADRTIKVKLGDNKIGEAVLELVKIKVQLRG